MEGIINLKIAHLTEVLNSFVLFDIAFAAAHLGMTQDERAVEPLVKKAMNSSDWLVQSFAVRALRYLSGNTPEAVEALKAIRIIEPPEPGLIVEFKPVNGMPFISLDFEKGALSIGGRARRDSIVTSHIFGLLNAEVELFDKIYPSKPLIISLNFESITTSFCKHLGTLLKRLKQHPDTIIYWYYFREVPEMLDLSDDYSQIFDLMLINIITDDVPDSAYWRF